MRCTRAVAIGRVLAPVLALSAPARAQPPPEVSPVATPAPPSASPGACDPQWVRRVHLNARRSVVKIESAGQLGTGFVFHSERYIATAFHVVELGRPLTVTFADGAVREADVVAVDERHDLAILELRSSVPGTTPLPSRRDEIQVGMPVVAIGHPFGVLQGLEERLEGLLTWSAAQGIVSAYNPEFVQTDAAINPGNSGGPLLGCDGRVLGVISMKLVAAEGISVAVSIGYLEALVPHIRARGVYNGRWTLGPLSLGGIWQRDAGQSWLGVSFGLGAVGWDRWMVRTQVSFLWGVGLDNDSPLQTRSLSRLLLELGVSYRFLLVDQPFTLYFVPGLGGAYFSDSATDRTVSLQFADPACPATGGPCQTVGVVQEADTSDKRLSPMAFGSLLLSGLELGYAYQANVKQMDASSHRIFLGLSF